MRLWNGGTNPSGVGRSKKTPFCDAVRQSEKSGLPEQGCQIFLCETYQNEKKYNKNTERPYNVSNGVGSTCISKYHKMYQHFSFYVPEATIKIPKLGFWV
jgi:hypothetical protein